jgi:NADH dehydrogenase FAD-containing subunit
MESARVRAAETIAIIGAGIVGVELAAEVTDFSIGYFSWALV